MKNFCALIFAAVLLGSGSCVSAETVEYPAAKPLFTIEVPGGWEVHQEDDGGALTIQTPDATVVAVFDSRIKGVKNLATAKEAVGVQRDRTVETTGFTDLREIKPIGEMQLSRKLSGVAAQYHAKFPTGEPCIYMVAIFTPNGSKYCSAEISIKAHALHGELEKQWQDLLDSITPLKKAAE